MLLNGFGFSAYRSFGNELTLIAPLRKINLIIGQNNTGKSNIINFLQKRYGTLVSLARGERMNLDEDGFRYLDVDQHKSEGAPKFAIAFPLLLDDLDEHIGKLLPDDQRDLQYRKLAKQIITSSFPIDEDCVWFVYRSGSPENGFVLEFEKDDEKARSGLSERDWNGLWSRLCRMQGGSFAKNWFPESIKALAYIPPGVPEIEVIPAIRKIGAAGSEASDFSGEGIIEKLAKIQNPPASSQEAKDKFVAINRFVQTVLENESSQIEIPYDRDMILVHMDGKTLPLDSLGTGVHEVIILAAAATLLENTIVCVEEPELHLHPLLQRKLLKYLSEETENQYIFTTHSAHLLDAVDAEIFHVTYFEGASSVKSMYSTKQKSLICNDLGYKASDILQANCIIWVEGPSDRIYLNYWLQQKCPELVEGIHYSIMFYGGRLFSHLSALDNDEVEGRVEDFISIRNLNRNSAILFDSDKSHSRERVSGTKRRLQDEFNEGPGFAWVTKGREIENYLDANQVEEAVKEVHPSAKNLISKGQWSNILKYEKRRSSEERVASKVKVAKHYVDKYPCDFSHLDLNSRLGQLVEFIQQSNV